MSPPFQLCTQPKTIVMGTPQTAFINVHNFHAFIMISHKPYLKRWHSVYIRIINRASLVAQWLRIRLPRQGTWVQALVREDPTCHGAAKPVRHSYWACTLEPASHNYWARVPQLLKPTRLEPMLRNKRSHRNEKRAHHNEARAQQRRPDTANK